MPNTVRELWSASFTGDRDRGGSQLSSKDQHRFMPGIRPNDPQAELVRRYARILRSAPAEAWKPRPAAPDGRVMPPRFGRPGRQDERATEA
jgi:hypothetical protein